MDMPGGISKATWWSGIVALLIALTAATFHLDSTITNHEDRLSFVEKRQDRVETALDRLIESQTIVNQQQAATNASISAFISNIHAGR